MGRPKGWASDVTGRPAMRSPGRPTAGRREHRQRFWAAVARGLTSEAAAVGAGVSGVVGVRWFREAGGMPSVTQAPLSGRYLSFAEREEIALLRAQGAGCGRSLVSWAVHPRRSLASYVATPRRGRAGWTIGPAPRSGTRIGVGSARSRRSWRPTRSFERTFRTVCRALCSVPMALR